MAAQTQRANVFEIALASAFHHWDNMVGIPKRLSDAAVQSPMEGSLQPRGASQPFQLPFRGQAVDSAIGTNTAIPYQYFFANITRVAAQPPFFDAPSRTKRRAALGNFQVAPTAQSAAIWPFGEGLTVGPTARHCSLSTHDSKFVFLKKYQKRNIPALGGI
jgi:hypothetical protein